VSVLRAMPVSNAVNLRISVGSSTNGESSSGLLQSKVFQTVVQFSLQKPVTLHYRITNVKKETELIF
jgi:hypothetical protein